MRVFLYEYFTGGGAWADGVAWDVVRDVLPQAEAMWRAVALDLRRGGFEVVALRDARLPRVPRTFGEILQVARLSDERALFQLLGDRADCTLLIAPETAQALLRRVQWATEAGWSLASPGAALVSLAGDKDATCRWLEQRGVGTPASYCGKHPPAVGESFVVKPRDGCGSKDVQVFRGPDQWRAWRDATQMRREHFCPGAAVSAAGLGTGDGWIVLPAGRQLLGGANGWEYVGGSFPLESVGLGERARRLAQQALAALPPARGFVGLDLVLGPASDGSQDVVVEVNPRLTCSYVPLSRLCRENLAVAMLRAAQGDRQAPLFDDGPLEYRVESETGIDDHFDHDHANRSDNQRDLEPDDGAANQAPKADHA